MKAQGLSGDLPVSSFGGTGCPTVTGTLREPGRAHEAHPGSSSDVKTTTDDTCTGLGGQKGRGRMTITTRKRIDHQKFMFYNTLTTLLSFLFLLQFD